MTTISERELGHGVSILVFVQLCADWGGNLPRQPVDGIATQFFIMKRKITLLF